MRKFIGAVVLGVAALIGFGAQNAEALVYTLSAPNTALAPFPGPYGTVEVVLQGDKSKAAITATALNQGSNNYLFVDGGSVALNTNGAATVFGGVGGFTLTGVVPPLAAPSVASIGTGNNDGFGSYNMRINLDGGSGNGASIIAFTIMKTSGIWSDDANVLTDNNEGFQVSGHFGTYSNEYVATGITGFATTPIPGAVWLFGTGLLGLLGIGYTRRRRAAA